METRDYLEAARKDPNLSHRRGYLQNVTRNLNIVPTLLTPEEMEVYRTLKREIELEMDLLRGIVRKRG